MRVGCVVGAVASLVLAAGCLPEPVFHCQRDEQCDRGEAPRCEGGLCTALDVTCPSGRRYDDSAGMGAACVDGAVYHLGDPCATDQPPPLRAGCAAMVCDELPQCCDFAWSDSCVQWAELVCPAVSCSAELTVAATRTGMMLPITVVSGPDWRDSQLAMSGPWADWLAPGPDDAGPRVAIGSGNGIEVVTLSSGQVERVDTPAQVPATAVSVDLDHSGIPVLTWAGRGGTGGVIGAQRAGNPPMVAGGGAFDELLWGPIDGDAVIDVVGLRGSTYEGFAQVAGDPPLRSVFNTGGSVGPRRLEAWGDVDGDHALDLVIIDANVRIHTGTPGISERVDFADCVDPAPVIGCDERLATTGAVGPLVPGPGGRRQSDILVVTSGTAPRMVLLSGLHQRAAPMPGLTPVIVPTRTVLDVDLGTTGPGGGVRVAAMRLRDLDGDDDLDVLVVHDQGAIVIGTNTGVLGPQQFTWALGFRIPDVAAPQASDPYLDLDLTGAQR